MNPRLLPAGRHWGLLISRDIHPTGPMMDGAHGRKLIWHTTEGGFASARDKFDTGSDVPHCLLDPATGHVIQYVEFDQFAKALEHPPGTPETNRAGCIQVEVAGFARQSAEWSQEYYDKLGALSVLIEHRTGIPRRAVHPFTATPTHQARRLTPNGFIRAGGHLGHEHAPSQPNGHWDPGRLSVTKLSRGMSNAEHHYL